MKTHITPVVGPYRKHFPFDLNHDARPYSVYVAQFEAVADV
jgi:hypothetical protein